MANEGRISSFDGATLTHPELRVVGYTSIPPPQSLEWNGIISLSAEDAIENVGVGGVMNLIAVLMTCGSTAGANVFWPGFSFLLDMQDFPADVHVTEATLFLYVTAVVGGPEVRVYAEADANAAIFAAAAGNISGRTLSHPLFAEWTPTTLWNEIDVTGLVQYWQSLGGTINNRINLILQEQVRAVGVRATIQAWDMGTTLNGRLNIKYTLPGLW